MSINSSPHTPNLKRDKSYKSCPPSVRSTAKCTFDLNSPKSADPQIETISTSLLDGLSVTEVDFSYLNDVTLWLRNYKKSILEQDVPDYETAKRIDSVTADLQLASGVSQYNDFQNEKITALTNKLEDAKSNLKKMENRRDASHNANEEQRRVAIEKLEVVHQNELDDLDSHYQDEPPPKYKKFSPDVIQMRRQEEHMRKSGLYDQAKSLREEREAVEAYELEVKRGEWEKEWKTKRDKVIALHVQQNKVLHDRFDLRWSTIAPDYQRKVEYWTKVVGILEGKLKTEKTLKNEAEKETQATLYPSTERKLPVLLHSAQPTSRSLAMSRVITVSGARTYTRPRTQNCHKRPQSSLT